MTIEREDILIGRAVDREASEQDWAELEQLAGADPTLWRRLGLAQHEHAALSVGMDAMIQTTDTIELPRQAVRAAGAFNLRWRAWSGWAAAAAICLVWATTQGLVPTRSPALNNTDQTTQSAGLTPASWTSGEAFDQYITRGKAEGHVLSELPTVMVQSRPMPDGKRFEVIILRRVMERTVVNRLYSIGQDDAMQLRVVPIRRARHASNRPM